MFIFSVTLLVITKCRIWKPDTFNMFRHRKYLILFFKTFSYITNLLQRSKLQSTLYHALDAITLVTQYLHIICPVIGVGVIVRASFHDGCGLLLVIKLRIQADCRVNVVHSLHLLLFLFLRSERDRTNKNWHFAEPKFIHFSI